MGDKNKILDHGFVRLVEHMGDDLSIVQAARVSYGQGSKGHEKDRKLLRYLIEHEHGTPFEMVVFKFHVKCPIFVMRQWIRHRIGSFNEISARYTEMEEEFYVPDTFRGPTQSNKQGSEQVDLDHLALADKLKQHYQAAYQDYQSFLKAGVAKEMARMILPVALYTQFYWSVNARSLMNFLKLRDSCDAQFEIRQYAVAIRKIFNEILPIVGELIQPLGANTVSS